MGATSASGGRPAAPVPVRWLLLTLVAWALLFGLAYAVGTGLSHSPTTTTTTTTRTVPISPDLAPGTTATSPSSTGPPPSVRVHPILPMPPAPVLRPYRLPAA